MKKSPSELLPIQSQGSPDSKLVRFIYRGPSMRPTFRPGQALYVRPQALDIAPGDVIVFPDQKSGDFQVVHRVISATADGLVTRGDNNLRSDATLVQPDKVIGKVEKSNFQGKIRPVAGGWSGLFRARILLMTIKAKRFLRWGLSKPYKWLRQSGIAAKIWRPEIGKIRYETQDGTLVKYVHKGKTVATHWTQNNRWHYRHPYDLILGSKSTEKQNHCG